MGRMPSSVRRLAISGSDGPTVTPCSTRAVNRPHRSGSTISTVDEVGGLSRTPWRPWARERERQTEAGGEVARHAGHRHRVGPVRVDLEVVEHVGLDAERLGERRRPASSVVREDQDAAGVAGQVELGRAAQHPVGPLAPELAPADLHAAGHDRAERGQGHEVADRHVERAAADLQRLAVAGVDVDELDLVGVGMGAQVEHAGDDDAVEALADQVHRLDGHAEVAHDQPELVGVDVVGDRA